jgi:hypothetical protein
MASMKSSTLGSIGFAAILVLSLLVGLRSCVMTVWAPPRQLEHYAVQGGDGRILEAYFFPDRRTMFWYMDPDTGTSEGTLSYARGSVGDHYGGRLWHVSRSGRITDFGFYPSGCEPSTIELETVARHHEGAGENTLPAAGSTTTSVISFCSETLYFQGMLLKRVSADPSETSDRLRTLETSVKK